MPTSNITVTTSWVKVAESSHTELLMTFSQPKILEVAVTAANSAPTVSGHRITREQAISRSVIGSGYVWAKLVEGTVPASLLVVVTK